MVQLASSLVLRGLRCPHSVTSAARAMNEFRIHHDVNELLSLLHVRGGDGAEGYIDLLQKHRTPYVTTTVSAHSAKVEGLGTKDMHHNMLLFESDG